MDGTVPRPIEGVILVVNSNLRGSQMVFRYPPVVRSHVTMDTLVSRGAASDTGGVTGGASGSSAASVAGNPPNPPSSGGGGAISSSGGGGVVGSVVGGVGGGGGGGGGASGSTDSDGGWLVNRLQWTGDAYAMPSVVMGPTLIPNAKSQYGQPFELYIGDTAFLGVPVPLNVDEERADPDKKKPTDGSLGLDPSMLTLSDVGSSDSEAPDESGTESLQPEISESDSESEESLTEPSEEDEEEDEEEALVEDETAVEEEEEEEDEEREIPKEGRPEDSTLFQVRRMGEPPRRGSPVLLRRSMRGQPAIRLDLLQGPPSESEERDGAGGGGEVRPRSHSVGSSHLEAASTRHEPFPRGEVEKLGPAVPLSRRKHMKRLRKRIVVDRTELSQANSDVVEGVLHLEVAEPAHPTRPNAAVAATTPVVPSPLSSVSSSVKPLEDKLRVFHVVVCVRTLEAHVLEAYRTVARSMATALLAEQLRSGYLANECATMLNVRERWLSLVSRPSDVSQVPDHNQLTLQMQQHSSLARELSGMYYDLLETGMSQRCFNRFTPISVRLASREDVAEEPPPLQVRPFETLLLLAPVEEILAAVPVVSARVFATFFEHYQPTKSFQRIWLESNMSLDVILRVAAHLVHWRRARVIRVLVVHSMYALNPALPMPELLDFMPEFQYRFRGLDYMAVLKWFSESAAAPPKPPPEQQLRSLRRTGGGAPPMNAAAASDEAFAASVLGARTVGMILRSLPAAVQKDFTPMLVWLLTRNILRERSVYLFAFASVLDEYDYDLDMEDEPASSKVGWLLQSNPDFFLAIQAIRSSCYARKVARSLDALEDGSEVFKLFRRLCPYLDGRHFVEEIMYMENVSREELLSVVVNYSDHITSFVV